MNITKIQSAVGTTIEICGNVHRIRKASGPVFVTLRHGIYYIQSVYIKDICTSPLSDLEEGDFITAVASVTAEKRASYGIELTLKSFTVLSRPTEEFPLSISQPSLACNLDANLSNRTVALRHPSVQAVMLIRSAVSFAFEEYMHSKAFIRISTPKISPIVDEREYIKLHYFDKTVSLSKSHTPYLIMAMGGFDRVYETGECYSSKNRNSLRHLNEYTALSFETAYPENSENIRSILTDIVKHIMHKINAECSEQLSIYATPITVPEDIPSVTFADALTVSDKAFTPKRLDPTDEKKICDYAQKTFGTGMIYVTDLPKNDRHFYERDDSGFVLLSDGIEIASGGMHISNYIEQESNLTTEDINSYNSFLTAHKYALPPIGGASIGLERFIMQLLKLENIRLAVPFPRDLHYMP